MNRSVHLKHRSNFVRLILAFPIACIAIVAGYLASRLTQLLFGDIGAGTFIGEFSLELFSGATAAFCGLMVLDWAAPGAAGRPARIVLVSVFGTLICLTSLLGLASGYEHVGSRYAAIGGLIGLPLGFLGAGISLLRT